MIFTILRRLTQSELGMFKVYRRQGKEGSKQRAINFDGDVVDRVFPAAKDSDKIFIRCTYQSDSSTVSQAEQWLKRQDKNWRLEGNYPESDYYDFVSPECLFAMSIDSGTTPATAAWVVIPTSHTAYRAILNHAECGGLDTAGMIALFGTEGSYTRRVLGDHYPALFPKVERMVAPINEPTGMEPEPLGLFDILANAGHSLPSAVADLVDNALSAGATEINIAFPNPSLSGRWMCINDNGAGMSPDTLKSAMRIGSRRRYEAHELGKYGFGLKGASWSQADTLTVRSKAEGHDALHMTWDHDYLERVGRWDVLHEPIAPQHEDATSIEKTGTAVLLTNMRPPAKMSQVRGVDPYTTEVTEVREHLALVFHRFLTGKAQGHTTVRIILNDEPVIANDPVGHPLTNELPTKVITLEGETPSERAKITLRPFVIPNKAEVESYHAADGAEAVKEAQRLISLGERGNETQGLYFYRRDRLIKWGGWCDLFALEEHLKLLRVTVDFDRSADDFLKVNISKKDVRLPVPLRDEIKAAVKDGRKAARDRYSPPKSDSTPAGTARPKKRTAPIESPGVPGTISTEPSSSGKKAAAKVVRPTIRPVAGASAPPWTKKASFTGEVIEVSEDRLPALAQLATAIKGNAEIETALISFLNELETNNVIEFLTSRG